MPDVTDSRPDRAQIDEVLRRIGRNLLLFQEVEGMLKFLVANNEISGPPRSLDRLRQERADEIATKTLGQLARRYSDEVLSDGEDDAGIPENVTESWIRISYRVEQYGNALGVQDAELAAIVATRNELVHQFLPRWDPNSLAKTEAALNFLDAQREAVLVTHERLRKFIDGHMALRAELHALLDSEEGKRRFELAYLRASRIVALLDEIAKEVGGESGWVPLATAGRLLRECAPDEMAALKERFGYTTLKGLTLATGIFDVREEPTPSGGTRTEYRRTRP